MNDQEFEVFLSNYRRTKEAEERSAIDANAGIIEKFKTYALSTGISLSIENFSYSFINGLIATAPGITTKLLDGIEAERDGLYAIRSLSREIGCMPYRPGLLRNDKFILLAHPHFRRGYHILNNYAPLFIELFWQVEDQLITKYIALDEDRVRIDLDSPVYNELDTWFGAPFDEHIQSIPNDMCKLRPPSDIGERYISMFFADSYCLDINWSQKGAIKTFQALELKTEGIKIEVGGKIFFPARYIHAEFDIDAGVFRHFDGAMQYFSETDYYRRRDSDFNYNAKNRAHIKSQSRKLFKLNGPVQVKTWVELCCHYLAGNPLAFEYFSGGYPLHVTEALDKIRTLQQLGGDA